MKNSSDPSSPQDKPRHALTSAFRAVGGFFDTLRMKAGLGDPRSLHDYADKAVQRDDRSALTRALKWAGDISPRYEYELAIQSLASAVTHANPGLAGMLLERTQQLSSREAELAPYHAD